MSLSSSVICLTLSDEGDTFADVPDEFTAEPVLNQTPTIGAYDSLMAGWR